ncbi:hypothetical protein ACFY2W_18135 [Streptomyces sp. NPDC001262]|uniref:hypothetical protein n=1 Tax=unclassified Streptomyces TaxID=2593676 RepID=UPI0036BEA47E
MDSTFIETPKSVERDCFVYTARSALDLDGVARIRAAEPYDLFGMATAGRGDDRDDVFAPHTVHMLTMVDGHVVAAAELVVGSPLGLPADAGSALGGALHRNRRTAQFRRPVVPAAVRRRTWPELPFGVVGGMVKACLQWSVVNDIGHVVADVADRRAAAALGSLGFEEPAGAGPLLLRVSGLVSRSFRSVRPFYRYLLAFDESVLVETFRPTLAPPLPPPVRVPERTP